MSAYLIIDLTIHDLAKFSEYINKIPEYIKKHSGKYIVQGEEPSVMEGNWSPQRIIVIEFSSRENANNFLRDPEAQTLFALRHETTTSKVVLVDGLPFLGDEAHQNIINFPKNITPSLG